MGRNLVCELRLNWKRSWGIGEPKMKVGIEICYSEEQKIYMGRNEKNFSLGIFYQNLAYVCQTFPFLIKIPQIVELLSFFLWTSVLLKRRSAITFISNYFQKFCHIKVAQFIHLKSSSICWFHNHNFLKVCSKYISCCSNLLHVCQSSSILHENSSYPHMSELLSFCFRHLTFHTWVLLHILKGVKYQKSNSLRL